MDEETAAPDEDLEAVGEDEDNALGDAYSAFGSCVNCGTGTGLPLPIR
jgi:hypothetical protein